MKRTVLFPTDFTVESLSLVKSALSKKSEKYQYDIILLHGMFSSNSISELLFISKHDIIKSLSSAEFDEACDVIRNKFDSQINSLRKDVFSGTLQAAFNNYVEGNKIDEAYIPTNYPFIATSKNSFDIVPFIKKSPISVYELEWNIIDAIPEKGRLAEVFLDNFISR